MAALRSWAQTLRSVSLLSIVVVCFGAASGPEESCAAIDAAECQETSYHSMLQSGSLRQSALSSKSAKKVMLPDHVDTEDDDDYGFYEGEPEERPTVTIQEEPEEKPNATILLSEKVATTKLEQTPNALMHMADGTKLVAQNSVTNSSEQELSTLRLELAKAREQVQELQKVTTTIATTTTTAPPSLVAKEVPHIVWQTGPWRPVELIELNKQQLPPDTEFKFFDNDVMTGSMRELSWIIAEEAGVHGIFEAYMDLVPWALKSDMWRLCVLYVHGGIYLDAKAVLAEPWDSWVDVHTGRFSACQDSDLHPLDICQGIAASAPKDVNIARALRHIVGNVQRREYLDRPHSVTGPGAIGRSMVKDEVHFSNCMLQYGLPQHPLTTQFSQPFWHFVDVASGKLVAFFHPEFHVGMKWCATCNEYNVLAGMHKMYCDELTLEELNGAFPNDCLRRGVL